MSRSLFEEAIADAKQLREAAEQNAKNAIIEAVTPRIREFIENQLVGGENPADSDDFLHSAISEMDEDDNDEEVTLDESALRSLASLMNGKTESKKDSDSAALSEAFSSLSEEDQARLLSLLREEDEKEKEEGDSSDGSYEVNLDELKAAIVSEITTSKAPNGDKKMSMRTASKAMEEDLYELDDMMDDDDMSENELAEAVLKLIGNADEREAFDKLGLTGVDFEEETGEGDDDIEVGDEEAPAEEEETASAEDEMPPEAPMSEMVYELDENMLRRELARIREAKASKKSAMSSHKPSAHAFGGGDFSGDVLDVKVNELDTMKKKVMKEARENRALKTQLNDYRGAVETLREQLSDLNLFNAKLLYVNKILQNKDVAPTQRRAIIEALDGASNLREAKLLYQSLTSSITTKNESLNESVKHTAGLASRPVTTSSARMSGAGEVDRWATLAGLK
jgi:hypothetical protein